MTEQLIDTGLSAQMAAVQEAMTGGVPVGPTELRVGVDLGTAYTVLLALDGCGRPVAGSYEFADVVRDGVVVDFGGAVTVLRRLKADVERRMGVTITAAHGAYPPGVPLAEVRAVQHVLEAADMDCTGLVDEPSAANAVLCVRDGVIVDVGGGTTGVAVVQDGQIVHTADEATGGTHFTLVLAGAQRISVAEAEKLKVDPARQRALLPVVRPVMQKVAAIIMAAIRGYPVTQVYLVGGSVAFPGFADVVAQATGLEVAVPVSPLFVTPLGIARCAPVLASGSRG